MLDSLNQIVGFVFSISSDVFALYIGGGVLSGVFAVWLLRKVSKLFDYLR